MARGYQNATRTLGLVTAALGVALLARTLAAGGGPLALGFVLGIALLVLGAGRAVLAGRAARRRQ